MTQTADIIAAAERAAARVLPAVQAAHRGAWQYLASQRRLAGRVNHPAVAVALRLKAPVIRRLINRDFPGAVAEITIRPGAA